MNRYFYQLWLPQFVAIPAILMTAYRYPETLWWALGFWFVFGYIGHGIGFHRLLAHRQFKTWRWLELTLAVFGSLIGYGPPLFWIASHAAHHRYADTDKDPTAPHRGFWHSVVTWSLKKQCEREVFVRSHPVLTFAHDKTLMLIDDLFFHLNWLVLIVACTIDLRIGAGWMIACWYERIRIGFFVNWLLHTPSLLSYRRYMTRGGNSQNLLWLYPFTMGFSLHNNHHGNPRYANEAVWNEFDLEFRLIKLISKHDPIPGTSEH
jgi:fatty-acid desaturase